MTIKDGRDQRFNVVVLAGVNKTSHPAASRPMQMVTPITRPAVEFVQAKANGPASRRMPSPNAFFKAERCVRSIDSDVEEIKVMSRRRHAVLRTDRDQRQVSDGLMRHANYPCGFDLAL
jgi:hypothetical protein